MRSRCSFGAGLLVLVSCGGRASGTLTDAGPAGEVGVARDAAPRDGSRDGMPASDGAPSCTGNWCTVYGASYSAQQENDERYDLLAAWGLRRRSRRRA
jgi:hypothetical protein